jgi:alcohol dehydrogenase class IV
MSVSTISYLTTVKFGYGALATLPDGMVGLKIERPLIVTDLGVRRAGLADRVIAQCGDRNASVFDAVPSNPTEAAAKAACAQFHADGCDGIVAIGGGSPIDLAKACALLATHDGTLAEYAAVAGGAAKIRPDMPPVIAVPTTAGTGAEVGRAAIIVLEDGRKLGLVSPYLFPRLAICDPELTLGLPPGLTAATGMDALTHCVETYLATAVNPPADAIALEGLGRCGACLERATSHGDDREARWSMMMAALEGAMAFQKGLGAVHAMSHALGGLKDVALHHGALNAVLLPTVLRFNADVVGSKYPVLARTLGLDPETDLASWVEALNARLKLPASLAEMGVRAEHLDGVAAFAVKDHTSATNPKPVTEVDYRRMLDAAMQPARALN